MILLDTHVYLFAAYDPSRLSPRARRILASRENQFVWSTASTWELAIKVRLGRVDLPASALDRLPEGLAELQARILPVSQAHALRVATLPDVHADPFDRLLVAQALVEGCVVLTSDASIPKYPGVDARW